jgi:carbamoyltransferase
VDGVGEWATASLSHGTSAGITRLKELHFPHSIGLLYSAFTYFLGFRVNSGEYKLMGLAPYGDPQSPDGGSLQKDHLRNVDPCGGGRVGLVEPGLF